MYELDEVDVFKEVEELKHCDTLAEHKQFMEKMVSGEDIRCVGCGDWFNENTAHRCRPRLTIEDGSSSAAPNPEEEVLAGQVERQIDVFVNGMLAATVKETEAESWKQSYKKAVPKAKITVKLAKTPA
ncbi:MAG: hypothetical protein JRN62_03290 [Nitrososphaerota archaeon]|jgi:hypothetical protein|nr:hypothetical protein [Nitrososphaerota archaeon]MDG6948622.1 hypothetical protein [Nitrososphaerota archaeon]